MNDDAALLRSYAEKGSEAAFTALVQRHLDLVYAVALRRVGGDTHLAADVTQHVFATLARQASRLYRVNVLGAWLHTATRNAAIDVVISEQRRKVREQASLDPALTPDNPPPEWERLKPVLDAAIDELPAPDREAIVLRFLERRPFGEIGTVLKVSADAARMRTERALDKLRAVLERRGITSTATAVGAIISSQPLVSAPAGLASAVAAASLAAPMTGAGVAVLFLASLMKLKTVAVAAAVLFAFGAGAYIGLMQHLDAPPLPAPETPRHSQTIADLRKENLSLRVEVDQLRAANARRAVAHAAPAPPREVATPAPQQTTPPLKSVTERQKAMANNLRMVSAALEYFEQVNGRPPASIHDLVGKDKYILSLQPVDGEDYSNLTFGPGQLLTVTSPNGVMVSYDPTGTRKTIVYPPPPPSQPLPPHLVEMGQRIAEPAKAAIKAYQATHDGARPPDTEAGARALLPYFATPQAGADFVEYVEALKQAGGLPP